MGKFPGRNMSLEILSPSLFPPLWLIFTSISFLLCLLFLTFTILYVARRLNRSRLDKLQKKLKSCSNCCYRLQTLKEIEQLQKIVSFKYSNYQQEKKYSEGLSNQEEPNIEIKKTCKHTEENECEHLLEYQIKIEENTVQDSLKHYNED